MAGPPNAVRKTGPGPGVELARVARPGAPAPGEVLVQVRYAGVCGTDLHVDDWHSSYHFMQAHLPVTLGHEFSGVITQVGTPGPHAALQPGDRVVVRPSVTCNTCHACQAQAYDLCENRLGLGLTRDGAFAEYVLAPQRNCLKLPDALRDDVAALAEPFTIAWQAIAQAQACGLTLQHSHVLVLGPGTIGQAIAVLARRQGAHVAVAGLHDAARCALLRTMGFAQVLDLADVTAQQTLEGWGPFDAIFEATGSPESIQSALPRLRRNGVLVATGIHPRPLSLDLTAMVRSQHRMVGSFRPPEHAWVEVIELLVAMQAEVLPLITHRLPLALARQAFDLAHSRIASKVLLAPSPE